MEESAGHRGERTECGIEPPGADTGPAARGLERRDAGRVRRRGARCVGAGRHPGDLLGREPGTLAGVGGVHAPLELGAAAQRRAQGEQRRAASVQDIVPGDGGGPRHVRLEQRGMVGDDRRQVEWSSARCGGRHRRERGPGRVAPVLGRLGRHPHRSGGAQSRTPCVRSVPPALRRSGGSLRSLMRRTTAAARRRTRACRRARRASGRGPSPTRGARR